jgi:hypothetical protein
VAHNHGSSKAESDESVERELRQEIYSKLDNTRDEKTGRLIKLDGGIGADSVTDESFTITLTKDDWVATNKIRDPISKHVFARCGPKPSINATQ